MSRFLLISPDHGYAQRIEAAIGSGLPGTLHIIEATDLPRTPDELLPEPGELPEALIFGLGVDCSDALRLAAVLDVQHPEVSVILVSAADDPDLPLAAMRAGVRDILHPDADNEEICIMLERACNASASRRRGVAPQPADEEPRGRVITVASPKGGIGKTTVATNLAIELGRLAPMSTVIVDLDAQFGDVATVLRIAPEHTLWDAVTGAAVNDNMVLKAFLSVHASSIYVLCAPLGPDHGDLISGAQTSHLLKQLASEFQFVIADTAPGLGEHALAALEESSDVVFVSGMDVLSVRGLRRELDVLSQIGLEPKTRHVVVNMADRHSGLGIQDIEATIGVPVDILIPRSRAVSYSTNKGEPLLQTAKSRDPAAKGLRRLAERFGPATIGSRRKVYQKIAVRK